jgi:hypothetical protein
MKEERRPSLLQTIKMPKNMKHLDARLPKANYEFYVDPERRMTPKVEAPPELKEEQPELVVKAKRQRSVAPQK